MFDCSSFCEAAGVLVVCIGSSIATGDTSVFIV